MVGIESARLLTPVAEQEQEQEQQQQQQEEAAASEFGCFACCFGVGYENLWRQRLSKSFKKAQGWSGSVADHAGISRQKLTNLVRRLKIRNNGRNMKTGGFHYDSSSYSLNFEDGYRTDHHDFSPTNH